MEDQAGQATQANRVRHQQRLEELCATSIRALVGSPDLHYRGGRLHQGKRALPVLAPHAQADVDETALAAFRGAADAMAMRLIHSDEALHQSTRPATPVARVVVDLLEQIRADAQAPEALKGLRRNLKERFAQWSTRAHHQGLTESESGMLLYTVAQICWSRVTGEPVLEETDGLLEIPRGLLAPRLGVHLGGLRHERHDQAAYGVHALAIGRIVEAMIQSYSAQHEADGAKPDADTNSIFFNMRFDFALTKEEGFAAAGTAKQTSTENQAVVYRVFTRVYDREHAAASLVRAEQLARLREQLDQRVAAQGVNVPRLARELKLVLAHPATDGWDGAQEEGLIDGRSLAQLISSPAERRLFRTEHQALPADCLVTFLLDCSGSMQRHVESLAMLIDVLARALEMADVSTEILGFTTGAWNGGRARRDWQRAGRPAQPGRLNEACNLVFKSADTQWRRARLGVAALLKGDLFREGIDGEAVDWACSRMTEREESRRILFVISDGSPMDSATFLANPPELLDRHLREVVGRHEATGEVEIYGVGVGLDLSSYYRRSKILDLSAPPGNRVFHEWMQLLLPHRGR